MKPASQLQATIELLTEIEQNGMPADRCMAFYFKQRRYIGGSDKAVISEQLYTILRHKLSFAYVVEQAGGQASARLLCAALIKKEQGDVFTDFFDSSEYSPKHLSRQELETVKAIDFKALDSAPEYVQLDVPEWIADKFKTALGDEYYSEMQAMQQRASTDIRVNTLKSTTKQVAYMLDQQGYETIPTPVSPWGLRFSGRVALFGLDSFREGWFEVQDEGSQLLALMTGVEPGNKVVDFCAGAGGKSLALAAMMQNKGVVYACDINAKRLEATTKRTKRAGVHNVRLQPLTSEQDKWVKHHKNFADVVLVDAPCTGTGTWRRSPDSRWNLTEQDLDNLVKTQQSILQNASRLVKAGGRLVYATCSLLEEENERQIEEFLSNNPQFEYGELANTNVLEGMKGKLDYSQHQLRTYPKRSEMDGFFACVLTRKPIESEQTEKGTKESEES